MRIDAAYFCIKFHIDGSLCVYVVASWDKNECSVTVICVPFAVTYVDVRTASAVCVWESVRAGHRVGLGV